ncbi:replication initiation and membrane attachment family protein [Bacillus sp. REN16]|uniref:replication initiation and membrane attachment family protein n=1 Tax=Bacillus sp. REN16 TaxID=2887296 RepID=UPI001E51EB58|nr:replication initiation and membrane attachment family protein [Bacillus sp. REN16]MCC3356470.1 replication initiation and membrane attachment family protein [Bacillus sp. REN16]
MEHWKEIVPVDRYLVHAADLLHDYDRKIVSLLYQPLIGMKAFSLYMTLWSELEQNRLWSEESTHYTLMALLQTNLEEIYQERLKLEGIGLLKTFVKSDEDSRSFIYELQAPLSPRAFFTDGVLNVYLYNRLGKSKFFKLKQFFSDHELDLHAYKPITKAFSEVFESMKVSKMISTISDEMNDNLERDENTEFMDRNEEKKLLIVNEGFNFDLFFAGISEVMIPTKSITPRVKEAITKLSFLYGIDPIEMQGIVMSALDPNEKIDIEKLRKASRDWYQFETGNELPALTEKVQPLPKQTMSQKTPQTKEEELIQKLERISPKEFLIDVSGGAQPSVSELKIIEDVMFRQNLLPGVVNVLLYYVMLKSDMRLTKSYIETIASNWARLDIQTVKEAMETAKKYNWTADKKANKYKRQPIRKELLPDWLKQEDEGTKSETPKQEKWHDPSFEEKKRLFEERLKKNNR